MNIKRIRRKVSAEEISLYLKDVGEIILDRKRKNIPHAEIARRLNYDFWSTIANLHMWPSSEMTDRLLESLNNCFEKPLHTENSKYGRALMRQFSQNDFFEREGLFLDNMFIRDLNKYIKNNNLKTKIIGTAYQNLTLTLAKEEKEQIVNFIAMWSGQFGSITSMPFNYEDITTRKPSKPKPDKLNPLIKKEKITSILP